MFRIALALVFVASSAFAADPVPKATLDATLKAVGGDDKLLKLFRIKEKLSVSAEPDAKGTERTSVLEPPKYWWVGKRERVAEEKEPATFLVWAWTLGILTDAKSKLETAPDIKIGDRNAYGIQVSETVTPAMTMYFDAETKLLARIDWRDDQHVFSNWKDHDGLKYPSKCAGYKTKTGKPWYFTVILNLERLKELPKEYTRK